MLWHDVCCKNALEQDFDSHFSGKRISPLQWFDGPVVVVHTNFLVTYSDAISLQGTCQNMTELEALAVSSCQGIW